MLFQSDLFSNAVPTFSKATTAVEQDVRGVFSRHFPEQCARIESVAQFGGAEVNSNNFRLGSVSGNYLLKRLPRRTNLELLRRQLELWAWLNEEKQMRVPKAIRNTNGERLFSSEDHHWCLFEFIEGHFFHGGREQMLSTGREIGRLQRALSSHPTSLSPPERWKYLTDDDEEVYSEASSCRDRWLNLFGKELAADLDQGWPLVSRIRDMLWLNRKQIETLVPTACHCDLHPHNILVDGRQLTAFIDFESLTLMPAAAALGFATYKLVRQHAASQRFSADDQQSLSRAGTEFIDSLQSGGCVLEPSTLRLMATAEVFRRLLVILRLNLRDRNSAWNHVSRVHLAGLVEIELIFSSREFVAS